MDARERTRLFARFLVEHYLNPSTRKSQIPIGRVRLFLKDNPSASPALLLSNIRADLKKKQARPAGTREKLLTKNQENFVLEDFKDLIKKVDWPGQVKLDYRQRKRLQASLARGGLFGKKKQRGR